MDGEVTEGESAVNQVPITGGSVPVDKTPTDEVYGRTINEEGYLEIEVTSEADDNTLSRIVDVVEDAQRNKTEREQFVERFSSYYTPIVVVFATLVVFVSPLVLGGSWPTYVVYEEELTVTDIVPLNENTEENVLRCARGIESRSEHSIGKAIVDRAEQAAVSEREIDVFDSITGKGVQADILMGRFSMLGNQGYLKSWFLI